MGNEVSTVGGAVCTVATSVAAGVCLGQVKSLNNAVVETAKFTGKSFMKTNVRHVGELTGVSVAAAATLGQVEAVNQCVRTSAAATGKTLVCTVSDVVDGTPVVGHIKGGIHYACGDAEGGDRAMKSASRTIGVIAGGVGGALTAGPAGAVAGGIAGGATMDGIITGADTAAHGEYKPHGQVAAWTAVAKGDDAQQVVAGIVGGVVAPVFDGLAGAAAGKVAVNIKNARSLVAEQDLSGTQSGKTARTAYTDSMSAHDPRLRDASLTQQPAPSNAASVPVSSRPSAPSAAASGASNGSGASAAAGSAASATTAQYSVRDSCLSDVHEVHEPNLADRFCRVRRDAWTEGKYKYVVQRNGKGSYEVHLQDFNRAGYCHADCAGGVNSLVVHAGEVELGRAANGDLFVNRFNSCSGHFKPEALNAPFGADFNKVAQPFEQAGLKLQNAGRRAQYQGMNDF